MFRTPVQDKYIATDICGVGDDLRDDLANDMFEADGSLTVDGVLDG
jgi:hypothetical protein